MADLGVTGLLEMPPAGTLKLIAAAGTVEPEPVVGQAQGVPQMLGLGRGDRQRLALGTAITEVQRVMIDMQLLPGSGLEHLQVLRGMSRSDVLDTGEPRRFACTICTAVAPLAVLTVRT